MLRRLVFITTLLVTLGLIVTGCGGGDEPQAVDQPSVSDTAESVPSPAETDAQDTGATPAPTTNDGQAADLVAQAKAPVEFASPGPPVDTGAFAGRKVWYISQNLALPFLVQIADGFKEAATAVGVETTIFDGKNNPTEYARGVQQAIGAGADAIVITYPPEFTVEALQSAVDAGITVINQGQYTDPTVDPNPLLSGAVTFNVEETASQLAAYAVATTDGPIHAIVADIPELALFSSALQRGFEQTFAELCVDGRECEFQLMNQQLATFLNETTRQTATALRANPDTNWLFGFDAQTTLMVPAVEAEGLQDEVRIGSFNALQANLDLIKADTPLVVDVGMSNIWQGWAVFDALVRAWSVNDGLEGTDHLDPTENWYYQPQRLFDAENLADISDTGSDDELYTGSDYREEYRSLWGVG